MKLNAEVSDGTHEVEIREDGDGVFAVVDGREYQLEVSRPEQGVVLIKSGGRIFEAHTSEPNTDTITVTIGGHAIDVTVSDPRQLRASKGSDGPADGLAEIASAMPGKVVRILLSEGDEVEKGQGVLVVEAMKMQNELKSPKQGLVHDIKVDTGDTVGAGQVLAVIK